MTGQFTVKKPEDFIALAPVVLGFQPQDSLVMMTADSFHARVDLPHRDEDVPQCVDVLLRPAVRHGVRRVAFVIFGEGDFSELRKQLVGQFTGAGVSVICGMQYVDGRCQNFVSDEWEVFDLPSHPIMLEAQYHGVGPRHGSRRELVESIQPQGTGWDDEARSAVELLGEGDVEKIVESLTRRNAHEHVELWVKVLRGSEAGSQVASSAAVLVGFSAWLKGDGALAWAAVDLIPPCTWKKLLTTALEQAVNPEDWPGP